jgi:hypothetical protein
VGLGTGLDSCGKSRPPPPGIRSTDLPAHSESLYRQSYPGSCAFISCTILILFVPFTHVHCHNVPLIRFNLIQSVRNSDHLYLPHTCKLKCATYASPWTVLEGQSGCRCTFSFTFDSSGLTDPLPDGKRETFILMMHATSNLYKKVISRAV